LCKAKNIMYTSLIRERGGGEGVGEREGEGEREREKERWYKKYNKI